jgi:hypothetical protein
MAASDKSTIGATFNQAGSGLFPDNIIKSIAPSDLRSFVDALLQSYPNLIDDAYSGLKGLKPGISTIAGLKAVVTLNMSLNVFVTFRDTGNGNILRVYELVSGTDAEVSPTVIRPTDYAGTTNEKVWKLALVSGSQGGLWNFAGNGGNFPTSAAAGTMYVAEDDHGNLGDADYVAANTWFMSKIAGADQFSEYSFNI